MRNGCGRTRFENHKPATLTPLTHYASCVTYYLVGVASAVPPQGLGAPLAGETQVFMEPSLRPASTCCILALTSAGTLESQSWYGAIPVVPLTLPPLKVPSCTALS